MAYGNNNNTQQKFEVTTRGISFFAHQLDDSSAVVRVSCKFYGDLFSIGLASPTMTADNRMTFPREYIIPITLKPEKAYALYSLIKSVICPAIEENQAITRAIYLDKRNANALAIKVIPTDREELPKITMTYLTGFTEGRPEKAYNVEFPKSSYYNACSEDGCMDECHECHTYFMMFTYALHAYCLAHGGGIAHSSRASNQYNNDKITNYLSSIANRLGISSGQGNDNGGGYTTATTGAGNWNTPTIPVGAAPQPTSQTSSFDDLPF